MNAVKSDVEKLVQKELEAANQKFPVFHSDHEGAAVVFEEIEECKQEIENLEIPDDLMHKMRSSVILAGAMLGKYHKATFTYPGDCDI